MLSLEKGNSRDGSYIRSGYSFPESTNNLMSGWDKGDKMSEGDIHISGNLEVC